MIVRLPLEDEKCSAESEEPKTALLKSSVSVLALKPAIVAAPKPFAKEKDSLVSPVAVIVSLEPATSASTQETSDPLVTLKPDALSRTFRLLALKVNDPLVDSRPLAEA